LRLAAGGDGAVHSGAIAGSTPGAAWSAAVRVAPGLSGRARRTGVPSLRSTLKFLQPAAIEPILPGRTADHDL
jgi:hypothetical protein